MKKILYICGNSIENWDIFTPKTGDDQTQSFISLVSLHKDQNLENISASKTWVLHDPTVHDVENTLQETLSYQELLENIFSHDLSAVI